jgi:hypothetical protein
LGGAAVFTFDPLVLEVVNGVAGISRASESPFSLIPPPAILNGRIEVPFQQPDLAATAYEGRLAVLRLRALARTTGSALVPDPFGRFAPQLPGTSLGGGLYRTAASIALEVADRKKAIGESFDLTIHADTNGAMARGGAAVLIFDPNIFELVDGTAGVVAAAGSPYALIPGVDFTAPGVLEIPFLDPSFASSVHDGPIAHLQLRGLAQTLGDRVDFNLANTRFAPEIEDTQTRTVGLAVLGYGWAVADFDDSGCTDLGDFFFLLDHWELTLDGERIMSVVELLALLDNWRLGPACP